MVPILVLHRSSGEITMEIGRIDQYASRCGMCMVPAILDGDVCVKLLLNDDWVATAQFIG
jgi:hypothetical protein